MYPVALVQLFVDRSSGGHTYIANNDSAFTLAYAVIMLNVDQVRWNFLFRSVSICSFSSKLNLILAIRDRIIPRPLPGLALMYNSQLFTLL